MNEPLESIGEIYDAIGDVDRWRRLSDRLAGGELSPEMQWHLEIGRRAHEKHLRLNGSVETLMTVHDQVAFGVLLVDRHRRVLRANDLATRLLAGETGLLLVNQRVTATDTSEATLLHDAIERASAGTTHGHAARGPFILVTRTGRQPLFVVVLHADREITGEVEEGRPVGLMLIDPELAPLPGSEVLRALFGFTAREAELAALLMTGVSLEEASRALGVAISTARTFLAHVTAKTDSCGQAELMKRLLAVPHVT